MLLESVPSQPPKFLNGEIFHEYNQPSLNTDYTSKGEAYAKFRDSTQRVYSIPPALMGHQTLINQTVLNDAVPFVDATYRQNLKAFNTGMPSQTSSSPYPTLNNYNSNVTTVNPKSQNAIGSQISFIRPKDRVPAYLKANGDIDLNAMRNTMRPTNGVHFVDTTVVEPIPDGLFSSPMNNYLAMPRHSQFPDKDVTISVFHNNNSRYGQFPSNDFVNIIQNILPVINQNGFNTYAEAENTRNQLAASVVNYSTQTLINDFIIVKSKGKYYLLPALD
jgi:hypothetical protein